jgi:hypothetical protein
MKTQVSDAAVHEYVAKIRNGLPTGNVFPCRMSDCEFTPAQRETIKQARVDVKAAKRNGKALTGPPLQTERAVKFVPPTAKETPLPEPHPLSLIPAPAPGAKQHKGLTKLRRMLYLQSGRCFFCGELLKEENASIEHLHPKSRGGTSSEDNEVVCHRSLNQVFGDMDLKTKFSFVLKSSGAFKCPKA